MFLPLFKRWTPLHSGGHVYKGKLGAVEGLSGISISHRPPASTL